MIMTLLETFCWLGFLLLLLIIPVAFGAYDPFYWSLFGVAAVTLLGLVILVNALMEKRAYHALFAARYVLLLSALQLLYVFGQVVISGSFLQQAPLDLSLPQPTWFLPRATFSANSYAGVTWLAKSWLVFVMLLIALTVINTRSRVQWAVYTIIISAVFHALLGIMAKFSVMHLVSEQALDGHFDVARGLFVNRNHYAAMVNYGLAMLSISAFYAVYSRRSHISGIRQRIVMVLDVVLSRKLVWLLAVIVSLLAVSFSTSRAAMLSLVGALAVVTGLAMVFDKQFRVRFKWLFMICLSVLVILLINGTEGLFSRWSSGLLSLGERRQQWETTWHIIQQYWLFGTGAGTYPDVFQYYRELGSLRQTIYDQAHSLFLQTLMEQGVVGFVCWLASLVAMFGCLVSGFRGNKSRYMRSVILGVSAALLMALAQSLVDFNLLIPALSIYFYCIFAVGAAASAIYLQHNDQKQLDNKGQIHNNDK